MAAPVALLLAACTTTIESQAPCRGTGRFGRADDLGHVACPGDHAADVSASSTVPTSTTSTELHHVDEHALDQHQLDHDQLDDHHLDRTSSTSTTSTTTTTTEPPLDVYDPACVVKVVEGDSLQLIADRFDDETVSGASVQAENGLPDEHDPRRANCSTCASTTASTTSPARRSPNGTRRCCRSTSRRSRPS